MSSKVFIPAVFVSAFVSVFPLALCRELMRKKCHPVHREQAAPGQKSYSQGHIG